MSRANRSRLALLALLMFTGLTTTVVRDLSPPTQSASRLVETQANVFTYSRQQSASLDADADGNLFAVWASQRQEGGTFGVFGRRFDRQGVALGGEVHVNQTLPGHQDAPAVALDGQGDAWVVWTSSEHRRARNVIMGRRLGRTGDVFGARGDEFVINSKGVARRTQPAIAVSNDRALIAWTSNTNGRQIVTARIFNADGKALTEEIELSGSDGQRQWLPVVAAQPNGSFVVAWANLAADGAPRGILAQRIAGEGVLLGGIIEVARGDGGPDIEPAIDCDAQGHFVIAWMGASPVGGYNVFAQPFDAHGERSGDRILVATPEQDWYSGAAVAMADDGRFVVAYNVEVQQAPAVDGSSVRSSNIVGQQFGGAGHAIGLPFQINAQDNGHHALSIGSSARRLVWSGADQIAAAWQGDTRSDSSGVGVSVHLPRDVTADNSNLRVDTAIQARAWPLGEHLNARTPPDWDETWVPQPPDEVSASAGPDVGFIGFQTTGWDPADADIAVGPNHIVAVVNQDMRFYEKNGTMTLDQGMSGPGGFWWELTASDFVFDPVALYDNLSDRFIVAAVERLGSNWSLLCIAVSDDSDPNGEWHKYRYDFSNAGGNIDFPNLGVGPDAIYITTDFFDPPRGNWIHIFPKQEMLDGDAAPARSVQNHTNVRGHGSVKTYDADSTAQYFVTPYVSNSFIQLVAITNPLGHAVRDTFNLTVPSFSNPPDAEQLGTTNRADTIDFRFKHGVYRNGSMWLSHTVGEDNTARTRWYEIEMNGWPLGGSPTLVQVGTQDLGTGVHNWFAAIDVDDHGNMALAFNKSSAQQYISVERTFRMVSDPPNTLRPPVRMQISQSPELGNRWGDYSGLEEDPVEPSVFWNHTMYRTSGWRTWVGRFDIIENDCLADVDGSGDVGFPDLVAILASWGPCNACAEDIDQSGDVAFPDLLEVLASWGACPVEAIGACCTSDGACEDMASLTCTLQGGDWYEGESCVTYICPPQPIGACCLWPSGDCQDTMSEWDCVQANGAWEGEGTTCGATSCPIQQQGDVIENPFLIAALPFSDTGNTSGFSHDYEEVCSFDGAQAKDVVYAYTATTTETVSISLCANSSYDTKLYVYENSYTPGSPYACNDDACSTPSFPNPWVSELPAVQFTAGNTYFIVVDGYDNQNGQYTIDIYFRAD